MIALAVSVPTPTLTQDPQPGPQLVAEKKIDLLCGPVLMPDGTTVPTSKKTTATFVLYQLDGAGTLTAWDDTAKQWIPGVPATLQTLYPLPPKPPPGPGYWGATLIAMGQKDSANQDKFNSDKTTGLPVYYVVCSFTSVDAAGNPVSGDSPASQPVAVLAPGANTSASVDVFPLPPAVAQSITLFLNDPVGGPRLRLTLQLQPPYAELFAYGASISIALGGDIVLAPAPGRKVLVPAALDASGGLYVGGQQVTVP